jgi:hypothetical protein
MTSATTPGPRKHRWVYMRPSAPCNQVQPGIPFPTHSLTPRFKTSRRPEEVLKIATAVTNSRDCTYMLQTAFLHQLRYAHNTRPSTRRAPIDDKMPRFARASKHADLDVSLFATISLMGDASSTSIGCSTARSRSEKGIEMEVLKCKGSMEKEARHETKIARKRQKEEEMTMRRANEVWLTFWS